MARLTQLVGKLFHKDTEVLLIFKVRGKYYPATEQNCQLLDSYLHTDNTAVLDKLTNQLEA